MNGRVQDPVLGRFISPDPSDALNPGVGFNRYAYALNNPLSLRDPDGEEAVAIGIAIGIGVVATYAAMDHYWNHTPEGEEAKQDLKDLMEALAGLADRAGGLIRPTQNSEDVQDKNGDGKDGDSSGRGHKGEDISFDKVGPQLGGRGWTEDDVRDVVNAGPTGTSTDGSHDEDGNRRNDPATVYGESGGYVVVNDKTGVVVQVSNKTKPGWIDDDRITWDDDDKPKSEDDPDTDENEK